MALGRSYRRFQRAVNPQQSATYRYLGYIVPANINEGKVSLGVIHYFAYRHPTDIGLRRPDTATNRGLARAKQGNKSFPHLVRYSDPLI